MHKLLSILLLAGSFSASAQHKVFLRLMTTPAQSRDSVYFAGPQNNWNPSDERYRLRQVDSGSQGIMLTLPPGPLSFKLTNGSWDRVETGAAGEDRPNRTILIAGDTLVELRVEGWKHRFAPKPKVSTASANVRILDTAFYIPQLNRHRRIWIYLPPSYATSRASYPVLYMHDGQNLFDESTGFSGEWGVDEALDTLGRKYGEAIVVGIDHGGATRINEYSPYDMARFGKGEGAQYVDFLVQTLKPWIDARYRTSRRPLETYTAGSSMGGLISMYAILRYPDVFGGAGVFSPAFWVAPDIQKDVLRQGSRVRGRLYFYAGEKESKEMVPDMERIARLLRQLSKGPMATVVRPEGQHREADWRREFPLFYQWLMKRPPVRPMPKF
ncbi:alpha/beta hydrolase [Flaviaesturariibacter amylovorans]|uniref:Alpha/beta hydrolase-fold protein n=1 Tax=Flaviaesturariibacter amylovorans TaxID=1084520 RepID=A0ABP8GIH6_9BACT